MCACAHLIEQKFPVSSLLMCCKELIHNTKRIEIEPSTLNRHLSLIDFKPRVCYLEAHSFVCFILKPSRLSLAEVSADFILSVRVCVHLIMQDCKDESMLYSSLAEVSDDFILSVHVCVHLIEQNCKDEGVLCLRVTLPFALCWSEHRVVASCVRSTVVV